MRLIARKFPILALAILCTSAYELKSREYIEPINIIVEDVSTAVPTSSKIELPSSSPPIIPLDDSSLRDHGSKSGVKSKIPTQFPTHSPAPTVTQRPSISPSVSIRPSVTQSPSNSPSLSMEPSVSAQPSKYSKKKHGPKSKKSPKPTQFPTHSPAPSVTQRPSVSPSVSAHPSVTHSPSNAPSLSMEPSVSAQPSKYSKKKHGPTTNFPTRCLDERRTRLLNDGTVIGGVTHGRSILGNEQKRKKKNQKSKSDKNGNDVSTAGFQEEICPPSFMPTSTPSATPSMSVTVSTALPTARPTQTPSANFTDNNPLSAREVCQYLEFNDTVTITENVEVVSFDYEVETLDVKDISALLIDLERYITDLAAPEALKCDDEAISNTTFHEIVGMIDSPIDTVDNDVPCASGISQGNACWPINGAVSLYLQNDAQSSRRLASDGEDVESVTSQEVLAIIKDLMMNGDLNDIHPDIVNVVFIGTRDSNNDNIESPGLVVEEDNTSEADNMISGLGISIACIAAALVAILAFLVVRRRSRENDVSYVKKDEEEDFEDGSRNFDFNTVATSIPDEKFRRVAHIIGEADSQYDGDQSLYGTPHRTHNTLSEESDTSCILPNAENLNRVHSSMNVHKCTSATCEICNRRKGGGVQFLSTNTLSSSGLSNSFSGTKSTGSSGVVHLMRPYPTEDTVVL